MQSIKIIGGGITGLITAIKLSSIKDVKITIFDKRVDRTRNQIIVLNPSSLYELPDSIRRSPLFGYVNPVECDQSGQTWPKSHAGQMCIELKNLECMLLNYIKDLSNVCLIIKNLQLTDIQDMLNTETNTLFIGADGYNSKVRQALNCNIIQHVLTYGLLCLFKNEPDKDNIRTESGVNIKNIMGLEQHRYRGFRSTSGQHHISIQLTPDEFNLMSQSKPSKGHELPTYIIDILESAGRFYGMKLPPYNEIDITILPISVFNAQLVTHKVKTNVVLLLGDAANGPNFISMSGANKGIKMARELYKLTQINSSLSYIYDHYEKRVEYILSETFNNMYNYQLDLTTVKRIHDQYTNTQLDHLGQLHNVNVCNLPKIEKCFILSRLFGYQFNIDESTYTELHQKLSCRMKTIETNFPSLSQPLNYFT